MIWCSSVQPPGGGFPLADSGILSRVLWAGAAGPILVKDCSVTWASIWDLAELKAGCGRVWTRGGHQAGTAVGPGTAVWLGRPAWLSLEIRSPVLFKYLHVGGGGEEGRGWCLNGGRCGSLRGGAGPPAVSLGSLEWGRTGHSHKARERPLWRVSGTSLLRSLVDLFASSSGE